MFLQKWYLSFFHFTPKKSILSALIVSHNNVTGIIHTRYLCINVQPSKTLAVLSMDTLSTFYKVFVRCDLKSVSPFTIIAFMSLNTKCHQHDILENIFMKHAHIFMIMTNYNEDGINNCHFLVLFSYTYNNFNNNVLLSF